MQVDTKVTDAYDQIDRYLRNNLDDTDYAVFSASLDIVLASRAASPQAVALPSKEEIRAIVISASNATWQGDPATPSELVLAGWRAALDTNTTAAAPTEVHNVGQIDSLFNRFARFNDFGTPHLRAYCEGFRTIAHEILVFGVLRAALKGGAA